MRGQLLPACLSGTCGVCLAGVSSSRVLCIMQVIGWENIELISDRPFDTMLQEFRRLKLEFPDRCAAFLLQVCQPAYSRENATEYAAASAPVHGNVAGPWQLFSGRVAPRAAMVPPWLAGVCNEDCDNNSMRAGY